MTDGESPCENPQPGAAVPAQASSPKPQAPRLSLEGAAASRVAALIQMRRLTVQLDPRDGEELRECIDRLAGRIVTGGAS